MTEAPIATKLMTDAASADAIPALIVFGTDDSGKPHASRFGETEAELATRAAGLMGMRSLIIETDECRALASQLPQGRVFASGRAFVPFVKKALYDRLSALAGPLPAGAVDGGVDADDTRILEGDELHLDAPRPEDWASIAVGDTVLIHGGGEDGWFEANVVEVKTANLLVLRWRDWPELPVLVRTKANIALMNPVADELAA